MKSGRELQLSNEINEKQIDLAKKQGEAVQEAIQDMIGKGAHGQQKTAGDYIVAWANEKAEGMYVLRNSHLEWQGPNQDNTHLEVAVCSSADGRFVPGLTVYATLLDKNGNMVGSQRQPFIWHPWLYHYGLNWNVPDEGPYTLWIRVEIPDFPRHDKVNGRRFTEPIEVQFLNIKLAIGQK